MHREIESAFTPNPLLAAQRRLLVATVQLLEVDQRLYEEATELPLPALLIAMEEGLVHRAEARRLLALRGHPLPDGLVAAG